MARAVRFGVGGGDVIVHVLVTGRQVQTVQGALGARSVQQNMDIVSPNLRSECERSRCEGGVVQLVNAGCANVERLFVLNKHAVMIDAGT